MTGMTLQPTTNPDVFSGGGEVGLLMSALDWTATPLGPVTDWPQSLRTAVSICLASRFPIVIYWGPEYVTLYNDAYSQILAKKHPWGLGRPAREVWAEIWPVIGPMLDGVTSTAQATWSDDLLLILERRGYAEECYFCFSFSPVRAEGGGVAGVFTAVAETTGRVLAERRLSTLRDLAAHSAHAKTAGEACGVAAANMAANNADIPFAMIYLLDAGGMSVSLAGSAGLESNAAIGPRLLLAEDWLQSGWPFQEVMSTNQTVLVQDVEARFGRLPGGPWPESAHAALVLPIGSAAQKQLAGFLIAGASPRRELDDDYRSYFALTAGLVATAVANARAYEEERRRAEALADLDRSKTAFFTNVSHEFRTPLTLMLGPAEDLLADSQAALKPDQREKLEMVRRNGMRLLKLVNTLLDFSRIEARGVEAHFQPTDLGRLTSELASVFRSAIEKAGMRLIVDCPPLGEPVYIDKDMWEKIVLNLLSNAFKFTFDGEIAVSLRQADGNVVLAVRDTGTGIPSQEIPRLFDRFRRISGARGRTHEGTGIGLALVQELVRLHAGTIAVESAYGAGSTFRVTVPLGVSHLPSDRIAASSPLASAAVTADAYVDEVLRWLPEQADLSPMPAIAPDRSGAAKGCKPRVLLADDNADMRDYVRRLLSARYDVEAVADGSAALIAAIERPPELVLTDVMMPELDGFGLLQALRADARTRSVPIILLSARAGEEARVEGLECGADDYLIKPFSARELMARVAVHIDMAAARREAARTERELRKLAETALAEADTERTRLEAVLRQMPAGVILAEAPGGQIILANEQAAAILGHPVSLVSNIEEYPTSHAVHSNGLRYQPEEFPLARAIGKGEVITGEEIQYLQEDGSHRSLLVSAAPIRNPAGQIVAGVVTFYDVTERKELEAQLRDTAKLESLGILAGGIAHDFNNLLVGVLGNASLASGTLPGDHPTQPLLEGVVSAAERAAELTRQLLAYAGKGQFFRRPVDISKEIARSVTLLHASIPKKVRLKLECPEGLPTVETDPSQLHQLAMNLVINGAEAIGEENAGTVLVRTGTQFLSRDQLPNKPIIPGPHVYLQVTDTGCGMSEETKSRIFDPFFTTKFTGRGLGLAAVYGIVGAHKGIVTVDSAPGKGSSFTIFLPAASGMVQASAEPPAQKNLAGSGTLLIVDDEPAVRQFVKTALEMQGYKVLVAENGERAKSVFEQHAGQVDLVLLDLKMPVMSGDEVLPLLRSIRSDIPVIVTSGYDEQEALRFFPDQQVSGFIHKPYTASKLAAGIKMFLGKAKEDPTATPR